MGDARTNQRHSAGVPLSTWSAVGNLTPRARALALPAGLGGREGERERERETPKSNDRSSVDRRQVTNLQSNGLMLVIEKARM